MKKPKTYPVEIGNYTIYVGNAKQQKAARVIFQQITKEHQAELFQARYSRRDRPTESPENCMVAGVSFSPTVRGFTAHYVRQRILANIERENNALDFLIKQYPQNQELQRLRSATMAGHREEILRKLDAAARL